MIKIKLYCVWPPLKLNASSLDWLGLMFKSLSQSIQYDTFIDFFFFNLRKIYIFSKLFPFKVVLPKLSMRPLLTWIGSAITYSWPVSMHFSTFSPFFYLTSSPIFEVIIFCRYLVPSRGLHGLQSKIRMVLNLPQGC